MSSEIDLSGEQDPTETMIEQQEQARNRAEDDENLRHDDHDGEETTKDFDVEEALNRV